MAEAIKEGGHRDIQPKWTNNVDRQPERALSEFQHCLRESLSREALA
jgi:hypothetical protein